MFLNAFRFSGWRCGDRPIISSQFSFFSRGVVTSCPQRVAGSAAAQGQDVNTGMHSCQHCSEVKLPKLWESPRGEGRNLKLGKRQGGKKSLKLKCLWQFPNYGKRCSCLHNPFQSQGSTKSQASFPTPPLASARPDQFSQHLTKQIYPREQFFQHAGKKIWQRLWTASAIKTLWGLSFIGKIFLWFLV